MRQVWGARMGRGGGCLDVWDVPRRGQKASLVPAPLPGLAHWQPHIERVGTSEVCAAYSTASQQHAPPPVGQGALVVKHLDGDDCVVGQPVVHSRLHVGELGIQRVLGPGHMAGLVGSRDLHQRVGQIIGLKSHCHTCKWLHMCVTIVCGGLLQDAEGDIQQCEPSEKITVATNT